MSEDDELRRQAEVFANAITATVSGVLGPGVVEVLAALKPHVT